jgi:tetratricopeptide (TPR) repeat protein
LPALLGLIGIVSVAWWQKSFTTLAILAISLGLAIPMLGLTEDPATPVDRFSYLPDAFFSLLLAWGASRCWPRRPTTSFASRIIIGSGLACCALLGWQSHRQLRIWENSLTLFARLETSPETEARPDIQEHIQHLEATEAAQLLLGGHLAEALGIYDELTQFKPDNYVYWHQRGLTLHLLGRNGEALQSLHTAYALGQNPLTWRLIQSMSPATSPIKP